MLSSHSIVYALRKCQWVKEFLVEVLIKPKFMAVCQTILACQPAVRFPSKIWHKVHQSTKLFERNNISAEMRVVLLCCASFKTVEACVCIRELACLPCIARIGLRGNDKFLYVRKESIWYVVAAFRKYEAKYKTNISNDMAWIAMGSVPSPGIIEVKSLTCESALWPLAWCIDTKDSRIMSP